MAQHHYKWKRFAEEYWELRSSKGKTVATVAFDNQAARWSWYFAVPEEFSAAPTAATAYAKSLETAKNVCEAIVAGFWDGERQPMGAKPADFQIPFKHGRKWKSRSERASFEKLIAFDFPPNFLKSYRDWNGGSIEGFFVFDSDVCKQFAVSKFLSLGDIDPDEDQFKDGILSEARRNPHLASSPLDQLPFIPFAMVHGSIGDEEKGNLFNMAATLAFSRDTKGVYILFDRKQPVVRIAASWDEFIGKAVLISDA